MDSRWEVDPENRAVIDSKILLEGVAQPDVLTGAMLYLASDASAYQTGQTIAVDGGYMLT
jgi:NAD(P)-dependent dehydrogenase (short-subunit alcohol dehydrogenase family)